MVSCNICGTEGDPAQQARVRSNVRKFADETFGIWRCGSCQSIHASDEVDLPAYYAEYPFHDFDEVAANWMLRAMYSNLLGRLKRAGFGKQQTYMDYGCGRGHFIKYLRSVGHDNLHGFDEFSEEYCDRGVLERRYDCLLAQDVIEHVPDPHELVDTLHSLANPGAIVAIGTPDALSIDLDDPEERVHTLHQPYHRHMLSKTALLDVGKQHGWELVTFYPTMYANTWVPFVNSSFVAYYFKCGDNNMDMATEPIDFGNLKLWYQAPLTAAHAMLGAAWAPKSDVMAIFRVPQ